MNSLKPEQATFLITLSLLVLASMVTGCAIKPWRGQVDQLSQNITQDIVTELQSAQAAGPHCLDADVNLFLTTKINDRALKGYFMLYRPGWFKFISANPLGQPLLVFTSDGEQFSYADTINRSFIEGELAMFAAVYELPSFTSSAVLGEWLTAKYPASGEIVEFLEDKEGRGVWVHVVRAGSEEEPETTRVHEYLLIDPAERRIRSRTYGPAADTTEVQITYESWSPDGSGLPEKISLTGLEFGSKLVLHLIEPRVLEGCREADFQLIKPAGYQRIPFRALAH